MTNSYENEIKELKQRKLRWRRLIAGFIGGAVLLVLLCGVVNSVFFAAGYAFGNVWPFAQTNNSSPRMIASYHVDDVPQPRPVVYTDRLYQQRFNAGFPYDWRALADGWDVQNGVLYGTNTRADVSTAVLYQGGSQWQDVVVEADVTAVTTAMPSSAQLLFRHLDESRTARCQLATRTTGQRQLQLITPEGQLLATSFHFTTGESYRLRATAVGRQLSCEVIGFPDSYLSGTTTIQNGGIGFQNQNITAAFDNLEVRLND